MAAGLPRVFGTDRTEGLEGVFGPEEGFRVGFETREDFAVGGVLTVPSTLRLRPRMSGIPRPGDGEIDGRGVCIRR